MSKGKGSILFRKVGVTVLVIVGMTLAAGAGAYAATKMTLFVNNQKSKVDPVSIKGVTYVPLRAVAEMLGANVNYNSSSNSVVVTSKSVKPPLGGDGNKVVGSVNGVSITKNQLYDAMAATAGEQTLNNLIQEELVKQEAQKKGIVISDKEVEAEIAKIKKRFPSESDFEAALQQSGLTLEDLKKQLSMQLRIFKLLEPRVKVTDEEVKQYFEANKASFDQPEEVRASHILVSTKAEADEIMKQLKAGADFAKLAKEKSIDEGSKNAGGDLGFFGKGVMVLEFEKAAFSLKVGELSEPLKTQFGYHIIKVTGRKEAKVATLENNKTEIRGQILQQKVDELSAAWLKELKSKAQITNTLTVK
ncbi:peptidylprolyl isomerase [Cohnella faecalis]|uniref:Foldase protein PrsA n=1 Tax=Cohnella faecalis TaxID=2315694 RepID=A0A398CGK1_9BACL|nr:peptidylprolyl isomerase [Cohnella faecalis]RIE01585.1 peptidylprolyl isomerase [Cohnella faecalis]